MKQMINIKQNNLNMMIVLRMKENKQFNHQMIIIIRLL